MSSPSKAHREAALGLLYTHPVGSELKWLETGKEPEDSHAGIARAKRVAQALASAEATAYSRGLADGAERERAHGKTLEALMRWAAGPDRMVWCGDTDSWYANHGDQFLSAETPDELASLLGIGESE